MSSSIFNGFKDGVLFAIFADYQVIIRSSHRLILTNLAKHAAIHGKHICVTSFPGIPYADLQCGVEKIQHCWIFYRRCISPALDLREWK